MTRFKDFGAAADVEREPISFALYGETFDCYPALQGKFLLDMVATSGNTDDPAAAAEVINKFFAKVLKPDSLERFTALIEDPERIVSVETLGEITGWLVEVYAARPTEEPQSS